jgi:pyrroline-5-carboxylate reductase
VYYLCECLEQAAIELGLDQDLAMRFSRQTIIGAAATLKELPASAEELRVNVTSKGGTTEAALGVLMGNNNLQNLFSNALKSAHKRAHELAI